MSGPRSTSEMRRAWAPACTGPWAVITLNGGARVSVRSAIIPAVKALDAVLRKHNYKATPPDTGAYNCRKITGGSGYSLHAYGTAIDINWQDNPWQKNDGSIVTDMPAEMVREIEAIRTNSGAQVWRCGINYTGAHVDPMHYEIVCTPEELGSGIRQGIQVGAPARQRWVSFYPGDTAANIVARGGMPNQILELQLLLTNISRISNLPKLYPGVADNAYGPKTRAAVREFKRHMILEQEKNGLPVWPNDDDRVGKQTIMTARWINYQLSN